MLWTLPYGNVCVGFLQFGGLLSGLLASMVTAGVVYKLVCVGISNKDITKAVIYSALTFTDLLEDKDKTIKDY